MRKVLFILGQLNDSDAEWIATTGAKVAVASETVLIKEGVIPPCLYILLEGKLNIDVSGVGVINELSVGEIVGEMSFVDSSPPQVNVVASGNCVVLELSRRSVQAKIDREPDFGLRFYRALSVFLADRLRGTVTRLGYQGEGSLGKKELLEGELDDTIMDNVSQAGERFNRMLNTLATARTRDL